MTDWCDMRGYSTINIELAAPGDVLLLILIKGAFPGTAVTAVNFLAQHMQ